MGWLACAGALMSVLVVAPPTEHPGFHPGLGWMLRDATALIRPGDEVRPRTRTKAPMAALPRPGVRPPSHRELLAQSRRARAIHIGAALAVQAGMMVYGVLRLLDQRQEARARRQLEPPPFNPYRR